VNGVLVVDKPAGITSQACVSRVKKILGVKKAGHTGTLDPMATGVLPICLGEATKIASYLAAGDKLYRATMVLGVETDTLDMEGEVISQRTPFVTPSQVKEVMKGLVGKIEQKPPYFSAVKYRGQPLYRWARRGVKVDVPSRQVEVYNIEIEHIDLPCVRFLISCSSGTYVRVLCADAGKMLGCGASLKELRRLKCGPFGEKEAVSLDETAGYEEKIFSLNEALVHLPAIEVSAEWEKKLRQGIPPTEKVFEGHDISSLNRGDVIKFINQSGELIALAKWEGDGRAKIGRVFHGR